MKYIRNFKTNSDYISESESLPYPCISYVKENGDVKYNEDNSETPSNSESENKESVNK